MACRSSTKPASGYQESRVLHRRTRPGGVQEAGLCVDAAEVRELEEGLAFLDEDFGNREVASCIVHRCPGDAQAKQVSRQLRDSEVGTTRLPTAATCGGRTRCTSPLPSI